MATFSDSFTEFLRTEKLKGSPIARVMYNAIVLRWPVYRRVFTCEGANYITMRNNGMISYLPTGKEHVTKADGTWSRENRQEGKPVKVLRKILNPKIADMFTNVDYEKFGNSYKAVFNGGMYRFEMKDRLAIPDVYQMNIGEGGGSLQGACMNDMPVSYFEIYKRCEHLRILTLIDKKDRLVGRALIWNVETKKFGEITFMDRIYTCNDQQREAFINYAVENKFWYKTHHDSYSNKTSWVNPETAKMESMRVSINTNTDCSNYPYIDTFTYGDDGTLCNTDVSVYTYEDTGGGREGGYDDEREPEEDRIWDDVQREYIDNEEDAVELSDRSSQEYRGSWTHIDNAVSAYVYGTDQEYFYEEDPKIMCVRGEYYWIGYGDTVQLHDGTYAFASDTVYVDRAGMFFLKDDPNIITVLDHNNQPVFEYLFLAMNKVSKVGNVWLYNSDLRTPTKCHGIAK